jgi:hypothetical protein
LGSILVPSIVVHNDNVVIRMVIVMRVVVVMRVMLVDNDGWFVSDHHCVSTHHRCKREERSKNYDYFHYQYRSVSRARSRHTPLVALPYLTR